MRALHRGDNSDPPAGRAAVVETLDITRGSLGRHLDHLTEQGLVARHRNERDRVRLVPERPASPLRLLAATEPPLRDRMIHRFTRLVDRVLSGCSAPTPTTAVAG